MEPAQFAPSSSVRRLRRDECPLNLCGYRATATNHLDNGTSRDFGFMYPGLKIIWRAVHSTRFDGASMERPSHGQKIESRKLFSPLTNRTLIQQQQRRSTMSEMRLTEDPRRVWQYHTTTGVAQVQDNLTILLFFGVHRTRESNPRRAQRCGHRNSVSRTASNRGTEYCLEHHHKVPQKPRHVLLANICHCSAREIRYITGFGLRTQHNWKHEAAPQA